MASFDYDVLIIGSGSGGSVAAQRSTYAGHAAAARGGESDG